MTKYFISVDWGTSNMRTAVCNVDTGEIVSYLEFEKGIGILHKLYHPFKSKEEYHDILLFELKDLLKRLEKEIGKSLKSLPILISGMASSSLGLVNLEYANLPMRLNGNNLITHKLNLEGYSKEITIVSGLKTQNDVMRGEETQVLGLFDLLNRGTNLVIIPGTHSKQIVVANHKVVSFDTFMTGELFNLLSAESILSNSITPNDNWEEEDMLFFKLGVRAAKSHEVFKNIFKIRSRDLLNQMDKSRNYHYLSGLMIGGELSLLDFSEYDTLFIISNPRLFVRYEMAMEIFAPKLRIKNLDSKEAMARGHAKILENE